MTFNRSNFTISPTSGAGAPKTLSEGPGRPPGAMSPPPVLQGAAAANASGIPAVTLETMTSTGARSARAASAHQELAPRWWEGLGSELNSGKYMTGFRDMTSPEITVRGAEPQ